MAFKGRVAIIAGGLGGLGTATGKLLRSQGAKLALLYAPFEASRRDSVLKDDYGNHDAGDITTYECDITSGESVKKAFDQIAADITPGTFPSILINAAGYVIVQPFESTSVAEATKTFTVNLLGPMIVCNAFFHLYSSLSSPPPGRIVSISSQAAHVALDGHGPYCASKAGLNGLTRCMANEWGRKGITANTVSPTVALTTLGKKAWSEEGPREKMLSQIPTGRFAEPEDIAEAIVYLCGDRAGMINGADVRIDGGFTIR